MHFRIAADLLVAFHFAFVLFVALGGFLVVRWRRLAWMHVPAAIYGVIIELTGFICPLTPLENRLRHLGGEAGYEGGFVEQYVIPLLYPERLTRHVSIVLAVLVIALNLVAYSLVRKRAHSRQD